VAALGADTTTGIGRQMLTWDEVRSTAGLTRFGGHTHTHPILPRAEPAHRAQEIRACRERIAAELGTPPTTFAYPNGGHDADTKEEVRRQGFDTAFSTVYGVNGRETDWLAVKRVGLGAGRDDFAWMVSGLWSRRRR
jgi:peptidoglycan/xylan/chitin deacetylase (PgdA/CDA1 family)